MHPRGRAGWPAANGRRGREVVADADVLAPQRCRSGGRGKALPDLDHQHRHHRTRRARCPRRRRSPRPGRQLLPGGGDEEVRRLLISTTALRTGAAVHAPAGRPGARLEKPAASAHRCSASAACSSSAEQPSSRPSARALTASRGWLARVAPVRRATSPGGAASSNAALRRPSQSRFGVRRSSLGRWGQPGPPGRSMPTGRLRTPTAYHGGASARRSAWRRRSLGGPPRAIGATASLTSIRGWATGYARRHPAGQAIQPVVRLVGVAGPSSPARWPARRPRSAPRWRGGACGAVLAVVDVDGRVLGRVTPPGVPAAPVRHARVADAAPERGGVGAGRGLWW